MKNGIIRNFPDKAKLQYQRSAAHIVRPSPWPFTTALTLGSLLLSSTSYFNYCTYSLTALSLSLVMFLWSIYLWFSDIIFEAYEGQHTLLVQNAFRLAFTLFILSEVMFFVSFFWTFFHSSLTPSASIFCIWPPIGINTIYPWGIPFLNTVYLVSSGVFLTTSHRYINMGMGGHYFTVNKGHSFVKYYLIWTIIFGVIFTAFQLYEYTGSSFSINDSIYGSIFFMATGFHGIHVLVGTIFLIIALIRHRRFTQQRHFNFECAAYYWHFVDIVWLFLFTTIYWWGS